MFASISIRTKLIASQLCVVALVSVFIYTYYPAQQEKAALAATESKIRSISNLFSIGVGIGMGETDLVAVSEVLNWVSADSSVVYVSVVDGGNQTIALVDPINLVLSDETLSKVPRDSMVVTGKFIYYKSNIVYQNLPFGSLLLVYSLEKMESEIAELRATTLYFCIGLFLVGSALSVVVANMISGNIRRLDSAVKSIAAGFENTRVRINSNDEIGKLGHAFNAMVDKLDRSRQDMIQYSEQLKRQNEELNQFSYVVSHDLKAPLRAIFKLSEWIEEDMGDQLQGEVKQNMKTLRGRVFRLEGLINGLLDYSKIGRVNVAPEKTDVRTLLKETIDMLNPPSKFSFTIQEGMPVFRTKKILLQQVFINLISNAIKYNDKEQGIVTIRATDRSTFYQFVVEDNGIGISGEFHEKVFGIFQTLQARDKVEGTGIGLSIIKKIVEDVGGSIRLESQVGQGSRFIFTWPKAEETPSNEKRKMNISIKKFAV